MILEIISYYVWSKLLAYQLAATLISYFVIATGLFLQKRRRRHNLFNYYGIPGPKPRLLDGNFHEYIGTEARYKIDQKYQDQYGNYYGIYIGDEPSIIISDLELLRQVFFQRMSSFKERSEVFLNIPISDSILFASHRRWKSMRKIISPAFSSYTMRGNSSTEFIEESIRLMLEYIENKFKLSTRDDDSNSVPKTISIDVHDLMKATALHMISTTAINLPNVGVREGENYVKSLDTYLNQCDKGIVIYAIKFPFLKRILNFLATHIEHNSTMKLIHQGLDSKIDQTLKSLSKGDGSELNKGKQPQLIDKVIKLYHEGKLTRREVIGNAEAILFAGYDTTSTTLSYIFWVLGKYPNVQGRLRDELMAHGVKSKYLEQVIDETMRLYPTVISFTTRLATETVEIDRLTVPKGARVIFNSWLMHKNPNIWPEPDKFDPERFREGAEIHPCAFAPFGLGERKCLGYQLAMLEMKMVICEILMRYRIRVRTPQDLKLVSFAVVLTKAEDKIIIDLEEL